MPMLIELPVSLHDPRPYQDWLKAHENDPVFSQDEDAQRAIAMVRHDLTVVQARIAASQANPTPSPAPNSICGAVAGAGHPAGGLHTARAEPAKGAPRDA